MRAFVKKNQSFGRDMLAIEHEGSIYEYRRYGHMFKDGADYSSDQWTAEEKEIAEVISAHTNADRKTLEEDIEHLSKVFSRAGVNYPGTRTGKIDASSLEKARETLRALDKAEALLASRPIKLDIAALVGYVVASETDKAYLQRIVRENNPKGLFDLISLKRGVPLRHQAAFDELVQLVQEEEEE